MSRNIVVCCDGTGNQYCHKKTNVAKLYELLENHTDNQLAYYDLGVGTLGSHFSNTKPGKFITKVLGLAVAYGITDNIEEAYAFLMNHYEPGDNLFLFGFSRGAFTVRALGGMLTKCGLLRKGHQNLISYVSKIYNDHNITHEELEDFRKVFTHSCLPKCIGVWDTVKSVGFYDQISFHDNKLNNDIKFGFHAVAIDERRRKFKPVLWEKPESGQLIDQQWFAGVHSDIGGSYEEAGLSNVTLQWMIEKVIPCGVLLDSVRYSENKDELQPDLFTKIHNSLTLVWRLLGWKKRKIEQDAVVHESVYTKIKSDKTYQPKNLKNRKRLS